MTDATPAGQKGADATAGKTRMDSSAGSGAKSGDGKDSEAVNTGEVKLVNRLAESRSPYVSMSSVSLSHFFRFLRPYLSDIYKAIWFYGRDIGANRYNKGCLGTFHWEKYFLYNTLIAKFIGTMTLFLLILEIDPYNFSWLIRGVLKFQRSRSQYV